MRKIRFKITNAEVGAAFTVQVIPGAEANRIVGLEEDTVKIELATPAGERTNQALLEFLVGQLEMDRDHVEIVAGHTKNEKVIIVLDLAPEEVEKRLLA